MNNYEIQERISILCEQGINERYALLLSKINLNDKPKGMSDDQWHLLKLNVDKLLCNILVFIKKEWSVYDLFSIEYKDNQFNGLVLELQPGDKLAKIDRSSIKVKREDKEFLLIKNFKPSIKPFWHYL